MTSWWTTAAGAIVVVTALGNGSKLLMPNLDHERRTWSSTHASSSTEALQDDEISFYDSRRQAAAYLGGADGRTVYLWSGEPVAYLAGESIYGFNGKHLGWYNDGMIFDHDGNVVVGPAVAFRKPVQPAPARAPRGVVPAKGQPESKPIKPSLGAAWSDLSAHQLLLPGVN